MAALELLIEESKKWVTKIKANLFLKGQLYGFLALILGGCTDQKRYES